jgi:tripartite-type tricarboxylate transporter receptor subunit TctC
MKKILILFCLLCSTAYARDIRLIVPYSAGGSTDRLARILSVKLSSPEYNFIIDYRLGAAGSVAANYVADNKNETVLMITSNGVIGNPLINQTDKYNIEKDFVFVGYLGAEPLMLVVNANGKIKNFQDFVQQSKTQKMAYGSSGIGSSSHLTGAIIANNNPNFIHIPYKGGASAVADFLAERIVWMNESASGIGVYIESGKVKPIAVAYYKRLADYPEVPTLRELKINDRSFYRWHVMVANASADPNIVKYLQKRLEEPSIKATINSLGIDATPIKHPETFFKNETVKLQQIIQDFAITNYCDWAIVLVFEPGRHLK